MNKEAKIIKVGRVGSPGTKHDGNAVYDPRGISPTLLSRDYKGPVKIIEERPSDKSE